jgi:hypothetical protein
VAFICLKKSMIMPLILVLGVGACGKSKDSRHDGLEGPRGHIQGVLVDGITGERIPVPALNDKEGIRVLTNHTFKSGTALTESREPGHQMVGEFVVGGVPVNKQYPIIVSVTGYQPFEGNIKIPAQYYARQTVSRDGGPMVVDQIEDVPQMVANIRLFPLAVEAQDLEVTVVERGNPVEGAIVHLKPVLQNILGSEDKTSHKPLALVDDRQFLIPRDTRLKPLRTVTGVCKLLIFPF